MKKSKSRSQLYIITGLSGAGKSQVLKTFEDFGYFCIDNIPVALIDDLVGLRSRLGARGRQVALGIDIRAGATSFRELNEMLAVLKKKNIVFNILFLTANNATLLARYSETRRRHPLGKSVLEGITKERQLLEDILSQADTVMDTSDLTLSELKELVREQLQVSSHRGVEIAVESFGYKYGIPLDADVVFDVRFLPNPNYITHLRYKTGKDAPVKNYINRHSVTRSFLRRFLGLMAFTVPRYIKEGKSYITIAIGCTGGRHRSVMIAEALTAFLRQKKHVVHIHHRDINRLKPVA